MMTFTPSARRAAAVLPGLLPCTAALAHPGHDSAPAMGFFEALLHLLTQPDHLGMLAVAVGIGVIAVRAARARRSGRR
jgi:hydrogenase/urease accessory protein HupE